MRRQPLANPQRLLLSAVSTAPAAMVGGGRGADAIGRWMEGLCQGSNQPLEGMRPPLSIQKARTSMIHAADGFVDWDIGAPRKQTHSTHILFDRVTRRFGPGEGCADCDDVATVTHSLST